MISWQVSKTDSLTVLSLHYAELFIHSFNLEELIATLEEDSLKLIDWFTINQMKANPDKFQALAIGKKPMIKI